jgi:hypothetical protein
VSGELSLSLAEVNFFVAAAFQQAALNGDRATFKACLNRLKQLYREDRY